MPMHRRSSVILVAVMLLTLFPATASTQSTPMSTPPSSGSVIGVVVNTPAINIRDCPRSDCASVGGVNLGDTLDVLGPPQDGFLPVKHGKDQGWAYQLFIASDYTGTPMLSKGEPGCKRIALIFNVGVGEPGAGLSWDVISALENQQAPATIFVQSWWAAYYPAYVADFANRGFAIGTHGDSDLEVADRTTEDVMNEILDATATIDTALGAPGASDPLFTPASTDADVRVLSMISFAGYLPVTWGIDSKDADHNATADGVAKLVLDQAYDGAIVQMHLDAPNSTGVTATAIPQIISTLKADGYTFVTIPEMALPCS
jgi:peptidoglycan/xylan/chitin deacetylase (PgdA/CDA1 family)